MSRLQSLRLLIRRLHGAVALACGLVGPGLGYFELGDLRRTVLAALAIWPLWFVAARLRLAVDSWWPCAAVYLLQVGLALDATRLALGQRTRPRYPAWSWLWVSLLHIAGILIFLRLAQVQNLRLHGDLLPELGSGDRLLVDRAWYSSHPPAVGDLVLYRDGVRRVAGLPGDRLAIRGNRLFRNGQPASPLDSSLRDLPEVVVPSGTLFLLGDPTNTLWDSRTLGPLPAGDLKGRVVLVYWGPWQRMGRL